MMNREIVLNPTDHPAGTEFVHRVVGDYLINDAIARWSENGLLEIRSCGSRIWFFPAEVEALEILHTPPILNTDDFAELVDACRALDAELPDQHENAAINAALRRIRAIVGRGVKMHQEGGTQ